MQDDRGEEWMLRDGNSGDRRKIVPLYSLGKRRCSHFNLSFSTLDTFKRKVGSKALNPVLRSAALSAAVGCIIAVRGQRLFIVSER
jgi:hypothetical protein